MEQVAAISVTDYNKENLPVFLLIISRYITGENNVHVSSERYCNFGFHYLMF